jgi:hypothetical protein
LLSCAWLLFSCPVLYLPAISFSRLVFDGFLHFALYFYKLVVFF